MDQPQAAAEAAHSVDVVIIGAGLAGLYAHYLIRQLGLSIRGFEAAPAVGGTWLWNCYPGARCDVESLDYAYSFSEELLEEWTWSERFATQPEILRYINHVADRFDLRRDIRFDTRVVSGVFDDGCDRWALITDNGQRVYARFVVSAVGCLSAALPPPFPGLDEFAGRWVQTSAWPREGVDLKGKRVGVIGTGSSGLQTIPSIAGEVAHLTVFQRTPSFSLPARNGPIDPAHETAVRANHLTYARGLRQTPGGFPFHGPKQMPAHWSPGRSVLSESAAEREEVLNVLWDHGGTAFAGAYNDMSIDWAANRLFADFVHRKIRSIVEDPLVADRLCPTGFPFAAKRLCLDTDYYATFNRSNVTLIDLRATPIERITPMGLRTTEREYPLDVLVFATGFDAVTGPLLRLNLTGSGGARLEQLWAEGPRSYLGLMIAGFPNLFTVTGPGSPSIFTNLVPSIEQHVEWIVDCLAYLLDRGCDRVEAKKEAQDDWAREVERAAANSLFHHADSWYLGANVAGKPRAVLGYMGGLDAYARRCDEIARAGYPGLAMTRDGREVHHASTLLDENREP